MKRRKLIAVAMSVVCLIGILPIFASAEEYLYTNTYYYANKDSVEDFGQHQIGLDDVHVRYTDSWEVQVLYINYGDGIYVEERYGDGSVISINGEGTQLSALQIEQRYFNDLKFSIDGTIIEGITTNGRRVVVRSFRRVATLYTTETTIPLNDVESILEIREQVFVRIDKGTFKVEEDGQLYTLDVIIVSQKEIDDSVAIMFRGESNRIPDYFFKVFSPRLTNQRQAKRLTDGYAEICKVAVEAINNMMQIQWIQTTAYIVLGCAVCIALLYLINQSFRR